MSADNKMNQGDIDRFWSHVDKSGDCWEWKCRRDKAGYGRFALGRERKRAHRISYLITHGEIPQGLFICHHCDNPGCVRPEHLYAGTRLQNKADCVARGRHKLPPVMRGEAHPRSKLTKQQVIEIRRRYKEGGITYANLGSVYGMSKRTIEHIVRGRSWQHVK